MALPTNVSTGTVTGQFIVAAADGADTDYAPDTYPVQGTVTFTASVPYLPDPTAAEPVTILTEPIVAVLDDAGFVCSPDPDNAKLPGRRGVELIATDDPDVSVTGWTWKVTYAFSPRGKVALPQIPTHDILVPSGGTVDLASAVRVPSSTGVGVDQIMVVRSEALQAAADADASATSSAQSATAASGFASAAAGSASSAAAAAAQAVTDALPVQVPPLVAAAIAADPTPANAAAAAVSTALGASDIITGGDPRATKNTNLEPNDHLAATVSPAGKLLFGIRKDGSVEIPAGRIAGALTSKVANGEYVKATVSPLGKVFEDAIGPDGRVPQWVLDAWAGRMNITPIAEPFDIVVVAGQSNATQADTLPVTVEDTDPRLYCYNSTSGAIEALPGSATHLGADFARNYVRNQPPGRRVLIVETAVGSTGFSSTSISPAPTGYHSGRPGTWDRNLTADPVNLYARMINWTNSAKAAAGTGARFVALIWSQGEDDSVANVGAPAMTQAQYAAALDDLIAQARIDLGVSDLPVLVGSQVPEFILANNPPEIAGIASAHVDTPRRSLRTAYIWGPENMHKYNEFRIHWSAQGQRERGRMFAAALYRAKLNRADVRPMPPQNLRATRSGNTASIAWDFPPCRITSFNLQYSTDLGVTWANATLAAPLSTEATLTISAALPLRLRVRSYNIDYSATSTDFAREVNV